MSLNLPEDYLSPEKRALVEAFKDRIRAGEFNHQAMGFLTVDSTDVAEIIRQAIYQDEQGPWDLEEIYTENDIARYELALENWEAQIRAEVRAEMLLEFEADRAFGEESV